MDGQAKTSFILATTQEPIAFHSTVALFFAVSQGQWKSQFDKDKVFKADFYVSKSKTCPVSMMYQETKFRYGRFTEDKVQLLELPYRGEGITMVLILPLKGTPLSEVGPGCLLSSFTLFTDNYICTPKVIHVLVICYS